MGSPASPAILKRFVGLEDQCLIASHAGKPIPAVFTVVLYCIRLPDAVRITAFGYNEIIGRDAARIANGERERLDRMANRTPHLHNGKTSPKKRLGLAWQEIAHALRSGPFGVVVVHARHDLAKLPLLAQVFIGRAQRVIEYKYPRGASLGFHEIFDLRVIELGALPRR